MSEFLLYYRRPDPITWVYLSSFLTIGLYFVFHRFWSIRNLDVVLLILLAPGLLMVHEGNRLKLNEQITQVQELQSDESEASLLDSGAVAEEETLGGPGDGDGTPADDLDGGTSTAAETQDENTAGQRTDGVASTADDVQPVESDPADQDEQPSDVDPADEAQLLPQPDEPMSTRLRRGGFIWLLLVELLLLVRLLFDPIMVRRPLLDPNLTTGGLNFIGISLLVFILANVIGSTPRVQGEQGPELGPGYSLMKMLPAIPTRPVRDALAGVSPLTPEELSPTDQRDVLIAKTFAVMAQIAIVMGMVLIGNRHFKNLRAGTGCALLYLLLPYTAQMTGRVEHAVPSALLLWAVLCYRKPTVSGIFIGLAAGLVYYPLFLLPLWFSFYWQRGARRFGIANMLSTAT
ncbi:MAG: hypothetical protein AAGA03_18785, partial [Planctomycetota bacterium]